ncbi:MAG: dethiobiotin synthase [Elusimicrobia bacterium]|nr:dethiobiotin synthase [Elusimicrobiota bacterium]
MTPSLFITATDTEVGKTFIACLLAEVIRASGKTVGVLKPFSAGDLDDATRLQRAAGGQGTPHQATLLYCPFPVTPAAQLGLGSPGEKIVKKTFKESVSAVKELQKKRDCVLVEGLGGVLAPLGGRFFVTDLMATLNLPIWVVARAGLGTINHTLLTVEALTRRGLTPRRILLNNYKGRDLSERTNAKIIKRLTGLPVTEVPCTSTRATEQKVKRLLWDAFVADFYFHEK